MAGNSRLVSQFKFTMEDKKGLERRCNNGLVGDSLVRGGAILSVV